jgi:RHS repeat-associated protein
MKRRYRIRVSFVFLTLFLGVGTSANAEGLFQSSYQGTTQFAAAWLNVGSAALPIYSQAAAQDVFTAWKASHPCGHLWHNVQWQVVYISNWWRYRFIHDPQGVSCGGVSRNYVGGHGFNFYALASRTCEEGWELDPEGWDCLPPPACEGASCPLPAYGDQDCQDSIGNPCDPLTGNKSYVVTDYSADRLEFRRTYQSTQERQLHSYFGRGWSHNYGGYVTESSGDLHWITEHGRFHPFAEVTQGLYVSRLSGELFIIEQGTQWILKRPNRHELYDRSTGFLVAIFHPEQPENNVSIIRDSSDRVVEVTNARGRSLAFQYADDLLVAVETPDGVISFDFEPTGFGDHELVSATYPDLYSETYAYITTEEQSLLTAVFDENGGYKGLYTYDAADRVTSSQPAPSIDGYELEYLASGQTKVTTPLGEEIEYNAVSADGWFGAVTASRLSTISETIEYADHAIFRPSRITRGDSEVEFAYDSLHREISRTEAPGSTDERVTQTSWDSTHLRKASVTRSDSRVQYQYNAAGQLVQETWQDLASSLSRTRSWQYCLSVDPNVGCPLAGLLRKEIHPGGAETEYVYYLNDAIDGTYLQGDVRFVVNPEGHTTEFLEYDPAGRPTRILDPNGVEATLTYDVRGRFMSQTVGTETIAYQYLPNGLVSRITQPDGSVLDFVYDSARRLVAIENGAGERIEYTLDAAGNRTEERLLDASFTLRQQAQSVYDHLGRLETAVAGTSQPTQYGYDGNGNLTTIAAPLSRNTSQAFDALNRLKEIINPMSGVTQLTYDERDNLTAVQDPRGLTTSYVYNALRDLEEQVSPDTGTTTYTYDSAGNVQTRTDARGKTGTYSYDALNRVTEISYSDQILSFTYDTGTYGTGRLTNASDANHSLAWTHDALGRVTEKVQTVGLVTHTVGYGYANRNLTSLVTPSGQTITYGYANGRPVSVTLNGSTTILHSVAYEPFGPVAGWSWGNSAVTQRSRDLGGQFTGIESAGTYSYTYDDASRITEITNLQDSGLTWGYDYDLEDRLTWASRPGELQDWTYDANSNRLTESGGASASYTLETMSNRLISVTGSLSRVYAYDAMGNVTGDGTYTFTYSDAGRLMSASGVGMTTSYVHNAVGERANKSSTTETRHFVYDEQGRLIGEYDGSGALIQETVWLGDIPVATLRPAGGSAVDVFYVHTDHLNSPRRVSRPSDNVIVWRWDSDPFGTSTADQDPDGDSMLFEYNLRFPGQYYDDETGLHYNYFRDYDSVTGRYVESDPIGLLGGINTYSYALNNPIGLYDPYGLWVPPSLPQSWVDFSAGLGDTLLLGFGDELRGAVGVSGGVDVCSDAYSAGEWAGIAGGFVAGGAAGLRAAGQKAVGREFSHWLPSRLGGPRTRWNGNYVAPQRHYYHDPYRYPRGWRDLGPKWPAPIQQLDRIPNVYKGAAAGGAAAGAGAAANSCECR